MARRKRKLPRAPRNPMNIVLQTVKDAEGKYGREWRPGLHRIPPPLRTKYQGRFARFMAEVMKLELKRAIKTQRFKSAQRWPPLNVEYLEYKKRKNLSLNMWEATSLLVDSIESYRSGSDWVVGISQRMRYPDTNVSIFWVARWLEYGTMSSGQYVIPPRPLFRPMNVYLRKNIDRYWRKFMLMEGVKW